MRKLLTPKRVALLAVPAVLVAVGIAIGAWNATGSGTGYAKAGTSSSLILGDASASTVADLYPSSTGNVKITVTNPNPFNVSITTVAQTASTSITSDKGASCNSSTGVTFSTQSGLSLALAAGATTTFTLNGAAAMSNASANACQGAVFSIPVDITAVSS
jgi:hypothetical protein